MQLIDSILAASAEITALRRDIHRHPELCFQEQRTSDLIAEALTRWGIPVHRGLGKTGVVGVVRNGDSPRAVGLRAGKKIARAIATYRETKEIETTGELVKVIESVVKKTSKINPATKVFQALRIAVNDEYGALEEALEKIWTHTKDGGRIGIITFHSGEDRIVKQFFKEKTKEGGVLLTKKPVAPQRKEVISNPRARSAKLRVIEYHVQH